MTLGADDSGAIRTKDVVVLLGGNHSRDTANGDDDVDDHHHQVPVISLSSCDEEDLASRIACACSEFGFFQVVDHGIPKDLVDDFREQMREFFDLPRERKVRLRRDGCNARGYFDDELTKRRRDWKECLDVGTPGSGRWDVPDDDDSNACLDGYNRLPDASELPDFRPILVAYFEACAELSDRLAHLMAIGLGAKEGKKGSSNSNSSGGGGNEDSKAPADGGMDNLAWALKDDHTSYLRMNYYPPCNPDDDDDDGRGPTPPLGISPHTDAGFLTVLVQDDDCHSLQVEMRGRDGDGCEGRTRWVTVKPVPGALTINTGAMAQIWSNDRYLAPLHRVLTDPTKRRYSAPFFYNPGYSTTISPLPHLGRALYRPCNWGYFRAVRFAGDLTDLGVEIQISDYEEDSGSSHPERQEAFVREADFHAPFSVEKYRPLLDTKHGAGR